MVDNRLIGKRISAARRRKNLTQQELGETLHVTKQAVSNWERGANRIDEGIRAQLEETLEIKISYYESKEKRDGFMIKPLKEIEEFDEYIDSINKIVDASNACGTEGIMLRLLMSELIGYECYYMYNKCKDDPDYEICWDLIGADLLDVINKNDNYPIPDNYGYPSLFEKNLFAKKIEYICVTIGGELFEDFDDANGYKQGFRQQIGRYGETCGYDLLNILPETDNSLVTSFKVYIQDLTDNISEICSQKETRSV